ncbi:MAG: efflux RND transporter periplasmic adaptor subunit [Stappiaceae bacterium]
MKIKFSYILALALSVGIGWWMYSGTIVIGGQADAANAVPPPAERRDNTEEKLFRVRVSTISAQPRQAVLEIRGRTEEWARVVVKAETDARLVERPATEGVMTKAGQTLCVLDTGTRKARVLETKAMLAQAELDFSAATKLKTKGFTADNRVAALKASRDAAQARLEEAEQELGRTVIKSPIEGTIESPMAEIGAFLNSGDTCATIVDADPMLAIGQVSERNINDVRLGMAAKARLITGEVVEGKVRYISPSADPDTRTIRIEIELPNSDGKIRGGVTALTTIPLPVKPAHKINSSTLTLDDDGQVGVRIIDESNVVGFLPVKITGGDQDGLWITGLPESANVITVGHEYVIDGQEVEPVYVTAEAQ